MHISVNSALSLHCSTNRNYFLAVAVTTNMVGAASLKEKEMVASLFCKLANLMRIKSVCFGSDTKVGTGFVSDLWMMMVLVRMLIMIVMTVMV